MGKIHYAEGNVDDFMDLENVGQRLGSLGFLVAYDPCLEVFRVTKNGKQRIVPRTLVEAFIDECLGLK